jgi:hypothetical protein
MTRRRSISAVYDGHVQRGHAGTAGKRARAAFEIGNQFFERVALSDCRSGRSSGRAFRCEDAVQIVHVVVEVAGGGVDGRGTGSGRPSIRVCGPRRGPLSN